MRGPTFNDEIRAAHRSRYLDVIANRFVSTGLWPTRDEVGREFARMEPPIAVGTLIGEMPRSVGWQGSDERITLTLFGLQHATAAAPILDGFMKLLGLAIQRYRTTPDDAAVPPLSLYDVEALELPLGAANALSEVVLREAPFIGSGTGGPIGFWERQITDGVMRYHGADTIHDYLHIRQKELEPPAFLAESALPEPQISSDEQTRKGVGIVLIEATAGTFVIIAGVLPFITGFPWWVTAAALGASGAFGAFRFRRRR